MKKTRKPKTKRISKNTTQQQSQVTPIEAIEQASTASTAVTTIEVAEQIPTADTTMTTAGVESIERPNESQQVVETVTAEVTCDKEPVKSVFGRFLDWLWMPYR